MKRRINITPALFLRMIQYDRIWSDNQWPKRIVVTIAKRIRSHQVRFKTSEEPGILVFFKGSFIEMESAGFQLAPRFDYSLKSRKTTRGQHQSVVVDSPLVWVIPTRVERTMLLTFFGLRPWCAADSRIWQAFWHFLALRNCDLFATFL